MALVDDIEMLLLRSIVERKETCRQAAEILATKVPELIRLERERMQAACKAEGHDFESIDPWGSVEVCKKCGTMVS